jgi:hypothetical protein
VGESNTQVHAFDPRDGADYTHRVQLTYMESDGSPSRELTLTPGLRNGVPVINVAITNPE